jgi:hypothetical protein
MGNGLIGGSQYFAIQSLIGSTTIMGINIFVLYVASTDFCISIPACIYMYIVRYAGLLQVCQLSKFPCQCEI